MCITSTRVPSSLPNKLYHILYEKSIAKTSFYKISDFSDIRGIKVDVAYGFSKEECLYLTRGKSDIPMKPLVDYICELEKGENDD